MPLPSDIVTVVESHRRSLAESTVWRPALDGATVRADGLSVLSDLDADSPYYLVEVGRGTSTTARFAIAPNGALLEAEGVRTQDKVLEPLVPQPSGVPVRLVWRPCDQSTSRLRPFWELTENDKKRYIRVDGETFDDLTITRQG